MLAFGIVFNFIGLGFFCWLLFALAVHALPVFVGVTVGAAAFHSGAGAVGSMLVALVSGAVSLFAGQIAFAATRSSPLRAAIAAVFAAPAAIAGYHVALGLADIGAPSAIWREAFALIGATMVSGTALVRIALYASPASRPHHAAAPAHSSVRPAARKW
jgi:hypothetical protein